MDDEKIILNEEQQLAIDAMMAGKSIFLTGPAGSGKCLGRDTPVLMFDGSIKKVQDISTGDLIMGDDSTPRVVSSLASGEDNLYEISNSYGDSVVVNEEHILTLRQNFMINNLHLTYFDKNRGLRRLKFESFAKLNKFVRNLDEIIDVPLKKIPGFPFDEITDISCFNTVYARIDFPEQEVDDISIEDMESGIPKSYLINSYKIREKLYRQIIYHYGNSRKKYQIILTDVSDGFIEDFKFLCKSIGYFINITQCSNDYLIEFLNFSSVDNISDLKIRSVGRGKYYGFTIDDNHRFVLGNFMITHNTEIIKQFYNVKKEDKNTAITSTTGVSAILLGGTTLHSYLGIGLGTNSIEKLERDIKCRIGIFQRWRNLETLVIDEISMLSPELFDKLEELSRNLRMSEEPFGGIQLILSGDFCFGKDTEILMYNGGIKKVQDVWFGDLVMGDDGNARKVSTIFRGKSQLFEITFPQVGEKIIVTGNHTLCLKNTIHKQIHFFRAHNCYTVFFWCDKTKLLKIKVFSISKFKTKENTLKVAENFVETLPTVDIIEMTVNEYLSLPKSSSKRLTCYKVGIENWSDKPQTELLIDPWLLGAWLGDGNSNGKEFTNTDEECVNKFTIKLEEMNCRIKASKVLKYRYVIKKCKLFKEALKKYNLVDNKHIPDEFMFSSTENRLKLLAGLLDTDGHLSKNRYQIGQSRKALSKQICFLARSLGLSCSIKYYKQNNTIHVNKKYDPWKIQSKMWRCDIGGGIDKIPCCVERKKVKRQYGSINMKPQIKPLNNGDFYGFELDGNRRFLLGDFTVSHNCQLPVVKCDNFCFEAKSWSTCIQETFYLQKLIRQTENSLQKCLMEVRLGKLSDASIKLLKDREDINLTNELGIKPTKLFAVNSKVDVINSENLKKLKKEVQFDYEMEVILSKKSSKYLDKINKYKKAIKAEETLVLKEGAQVLLTANIDINSGLVNGSRGVVTGFVEDLPMVKFMNAEERLIDFYCWKVEETDVEIAQIFQIPLKLAYACTIHSSQGMSLDCVEISIKEIFEYGQAYVALSRVRTLEGLCIRNFDVKKIKAHPKALKFYKELETKQ